jgi:hypothetical protein
MGKRRITDLSVSEIEREEERRGTRDTREPRSFSSRGSEIPEVTQPPGKPWGFFLVLAAIVAVAVMYSVTLLSLQDIIKNPATAVGAMSAAFAVIGTLVGTYFGIKAGLDGQEKAKETVTRAIRADAERQRERSREADERSRDRQRSQEQQRGERERRERE